MHVDLSVHPDYAHLDSIPGVGTRFELTVTVLRRLRGLNAFDLPWLSGRGRPYIKARGVPVVFALRGASLVDDSALTAVGTHVELKIAQIDHRTPQSVIVVARGDMLTAFKGATVPHESYLRQQLERPDDNTACLLPTGRYLCQRGTHGRGSQRISNALILSRREPIVVQRRRTAPAPSEPFFGPGARLDDLHPATNLHAARTTHRAAHHTTFSSAGCLTVPGTNRSGPWRTFVQRVAHRGEKWREVIVLTGAEACIAADPHATPVPRIRPGSMRRRIRDLQHLLRITPDGRMGRRTADAALKRWGTWNVPAADVPPAED